MRNKYNIAKILLKNINSVLGLNKSLLILKKFLPVLHPKYAFSITWLCLDEIPLEPKTELEYTYGSLRNFPQVKVKVNPKCLHSRFFALSGYYEEELTQEILSPKRKGLLIDIGANFGYYPVLWLQKEDTRVIAVEPVVEYVQLLHENLKNYGARYVVFDGCIGDRDGVAFIDTLGDPTMLTKVVADGDRKEARQVSMLTLNSLLKKYNEEKIDILKIDAEGYDIAILESCKPLFEAKAVKTVFWETANTPKEKIIVEFLENLGYSKILNKAITGYELPSL